MEIMRLAFVGMGSIGRRHLTNTCACLEERNRLYSIDLYRSGNGSELDNSLLQKVSNQYPYMEPLPTDTQYDVVFVTNPTAKHWETIRKFASSAKAMFIEKPVFTQADMDIKSLGLRDDAIYYVACPLRYHPVIEYVRQNIPCETALSVRAISSSYLPNWRPGVDYRTTYSAQQAMGGGVDIDLIHEWDYLSLLFGEMDEGAAIRAKLSNLEINSHDIAVYIARTKQTAIELHLDYFGQKDIRSLQIFLPEDTVSCDILNSTITYLKSGRTLVFDKDRDGYQRKELHHFFDILDGTCSNDNDIPSALRVLRYAQGNFLKCGLASPQNISNIRK